MGAPAGNRNAAKAKEWEMALRRAFIKKHGSLREGLDKVAVKAVEAAEAGDQWAIAEIANRFDGKPAQSLEVTGDMTTRTAKEVSDDRLADIATGSSEGTIGAAEGSPESAGIH